MILSLFYVTPTSSNPIWEEQKRWSHYKAVPNALKVFLEEEYSKAKIAEDRERGIVPVPNTDLKVRTFKIDPTRITRAF